VNGVPIFLQVTPITPLQSMTGTWLGHELTFDHAGGKNWFVLAGVSLETRPGRYPLKVEAVTTAGKHVHFEQELLVGREKYPAIELKVSKQYTEPNPEQQTEIKQAQDIKHEAFNKITPERGWSGMFAAPVNAPSSDIFGTRRVFNGVTKSVHQGLDYRVGPGTPVMAINSGTVLLARFLYFEGNCVVVDHGQGLLSLYLHLSELKVKEGEHIDRGEEVGLSGATGRATGPHLHLAVRWQGVYVNPAVLLRLPLPEAKVKTATGM
jgi:murein DD-endopeptidase MepM/ murein hydrolase activator NlpD